MPEGRLLDIRPISSTPQLEIISGDIVKLAGPLDDSPGILNDTVANEEIREVASRGMFVKEREESFAYAYYWDTIDQMQAYVEDRWSDFMMLPEPTLEMAHQLVKGSREQVRIRIRRKMLISRYKKEAATK